MPATYDTFGPFPFPPLQGGNFRRCLQGFWQDVAEEKGCERLHSSVGVYVWAYRAGDKLLPWNVGKTDKQSFEKRFLQKELTFHHFLQECPDVEIFAFLLARLTPGKKPRKPTTRARISSNEWLETMLIAAAKRKNPQLRNFSKTKKLETIVPGYLNDSSLPESDAAKAFRKLLA